MVIRYLFYLALCICVAPYAIADNTCEVRDISSSKSGEDVFALHALRLEWMRSAYVCRMGEYEIATPSNSTPDNNNSIFIFKNGKPVFHRDNGATNVYSPKLEDAEFSNALVNIWHGNEHQDVERLWYQTVGNEPQVQQYDENFDGQPDFKVVWKGEKIIETYKWVKGHWQKLESQKASPNKPIKPTQ